MGRRETGVTSVRPAAHRCAVGGGSNGWRVEVSRRPQPFATRAMPWLARYPIEANVLTSYLESVLSGQREAADARWIHVLDPDGEVAGAAMHIGSWQVFLSPMPTPAVHAVAHALAGRRPAVPGVGGTCPEAATFAAAWRDLTGARYWRSMAQRMYSLRDVRRPAAVSGGARPAGRADEDLCIAWFSAFAAEADPNSPGPDSTAEITRRIALGLLVLWEDGGEPVSLAGLGRPAVGVARIGPVYTPPDRRRHGYGEAVTAAASQAALDGGAERCMLYTDLANPTSNAIYQRIGYRPVADAEMFRFRAPGRRN
jgi:GNAT superfamily N-acetyltransferase